MSKGGGELGRGVEEKLGPDDPDNTDGFVVSDKSVPYSYDTKNFSQRACLGMFLSKIGMTTRPRNLKLRTMSFKQN